MHQSPADRTSSPWRNWFRRTVEPECQLSLRETRAIVAGADQLLEDCEAGAPSWASRPSPGAPETAAVLRGSQPMAAALGGALASLSAPGVFEDAVHLRVMAVLARDVGVGRPTASRYDDFHRVMAVHRLQQEARPRPQLPDSRLPDDLFAAPTFVMALSRRPDLFAAELLGWDHHIRSEGLLAPWAWLRDAGVAGDWERLDLRRTDDGDDGLAVEIMWCIEAADLDPARVRWGAEAAATLHGQWEAALWRWTASTADPVEAFVDLIRRRSREALVYHDTTRLEGRSIQGWFEEARHDPRAFVDAIGRSRYVRPGQPERSHLLTTLTDFGSPMFRVFSPEDREIISRWIVSLADGAPVDVAANSRRAAPRGPDLSRHLAAVSDVADQGESPKSIREAYVAHSQGRHCSPAVLRFAEDYVDHWLSLARHSLDRHPFPLPEDIPSPGDLREWLLAAHDKHADAVDPEDGDQHLPSREDLVNSTIQLAPLTLIDGSWLMGFSDLSLASTRIGFSLFETYWDELGNGDIEINHPKLYPTCSMEWTSFSPRPLARLRAQRVLRDEGLSCRSTGWRSDGSRSSQPEVLVSTSPWLLGRRQLSTAHLPSARTASRRSSLTSTTCLHGTFGMGGRGRRGLRQNLAHWWDTGRPGDPLATRAHRFRVAGPRPHEAVRLHRITGR